LIPNPCLLKEHTPYLSAPDMIALVKPPKNFAIKDEERFSPQYTIKYCIDTLEALQNEPNESCLFLETSNIALV
jgi:hypothetical protein